MRKNLLFIIVIALIICQSASAQYLSNPESAVYDSLYSRYLVSNWSNGRIVQIDSNGVQSLFVSGSGDFAGLCIVGDSLYAACQDEGVRGYNLHTGDEVMNRSIPDILLLNDITSDNSGNLYISDPQAHVIIRAPINGEGSTVFASTSLNVPNGMVFDETNNRLVLVSARNNSPIQAVNLADSSVYYIRATTMDILDGLTRDLQGNYYVSSWGTNSVYRFNYDFSIGPDLISSHNASPADIFYNKHDNNLAVPIFYGHTINFVQVEPTSIRENNRQLPAIVELNQNYPNPFNAATTITFSLPETQHISINIYNLLGQRVATIFDDAMPAGERSLTWNADQYPTGIYFAQLFTANNSKNIKITLLK
ncbi:MAG: T9SS type A sorting domain-containing protein [candidate division Zixibacteria bacterium]|nr:T9SS type A sorting domain-containing protein [candidate division Zixibacteria bacterium]